MQLLQPTKNHRITQVFGDRKAVYGGIGHTGTDFGPVVPGKPGDSILAVDEGTIVRNSFDADGYGRYIDQRLTNLSALLNAEVIARYGHLLQSNVHTGDYAHMGDEIALMDSTGWSTDDHLHFELRINGKPVDPLPYLTLSYNDFMNELQKLRQDNDNAYVEQNKRLDSIEQVNRDQEGRLEKQSTRINEAVDEAKDGNKILRARVEKELGHELPKLSSEEREQAVGKDK